MRRQKILPIYRDTLRIALPFGPSVDKVLFNEINKTHPKFQYHLFTLSPTLGTYSGHTYTPNVLLKYRYVYM